MLPSFNLLVALMKPTLQIVLIENHQIVVKIQLNHN